MKCVYVFSLVVSILVFPFENSVRMIPYMHKKNHTYISTCRNDEGKINVMWHKTLLQAFFEWACFWKMSIYWVKQTYHRAAEFERDIWRSSHPTILLRAGSAGAGCAGPRPVRLWLSPYTEPLQPLWAACASVWSPSEEENFFLCLNSISCGSVLAHCLLSRHWAPPSRVGLFLLYLPHHVVIFMDKMPLSFPISRLSSPNSLSRSSYGRCSSLLNTFVALHWTRSSISMSHLVWEIGV